MQRLSNPSESLDNVQRPDKYKPHGTRIDKLIPASVVESLGALKARLS